MSDNSIRVRQIQEWLLQGQLVVDICRNITKAWSIDQSEAMKYIADAFEDFNTQANKGYAQTKAYHIQLRLSLYREAVKEKDLKLALQILTDLAKLDDVYPE